MHSHFCWEKERDRYNVYAPQKKRQREVGEKIRSSEIEHFGAERERETKKFFASCRYAIQCIFNLQYLSSSAGCLSPSFPNTP